MFGQLTLFGQSADPLTGLNRERSGCHHFHPDKIYLWKLERNFSAVSTEAELAIWQFDPVDAGSSV